TRPARAASRQLPAAALPEHVLAFPGCDLDRGLHIRLSAGSAVMRQAEPNDHAHDHAHDDVLEGSHFAMRTYLLGFGAAAILTAIPFWIVMTRAIGNTAVAIAVIVALAVAQILVHTFAFLHVNARAQGGWTLVAYVFTAVLVVI